MLFSMILENICVIYTRYAVVFISCWTASREFSNWLKEKQIKKQPPSTVAAKKSSGLLLFGLPSLKLTCPLEMDGWKMYFLLNWSFFLGGLC